MAETAQQIVDDYAWKRGVSVEEARAELQVTQSEIERQFAIVRDKRLQEGREVDDFLLWLEVEMQILNSARAMILRITCNIRHSSPKKWLKPKSAA